MQLFKNFIPDYRFRKISDIPLLLFEGAELIVLDLDNTIVASGTLETTQEVIDWIKDINQKYHCIIFSNSFDYYQRAPKVQTLFNCELFLSKSKKPFRTLFLQIKTKYQFENSKVFVIGDHIVTDVLFGKTNGTKTILVDRLTTKEYFLMKWLRILENFITYNKKYEN